MPARGRFGLSFLTLSSSDSWGTSTQTTQPGFGVPHPPPAPPQKNPQQVGVQDPSDQLNAEGPCTVSHAEGHDTQKDVERHG